MGRRDAGSRSPEGVVIRTDPRDRGPLPCKAQSSEDLPAPLRPMTATTSPALTRRSTPRTACTRPWWTCRSRADRRDCAGAWAAAVTRADGGAADSTSRARSGAARRRASRTDSGTGRHPARRPSSTIGGATCESRRMSGGRPWTAAPSLLRLMTRSAYCTTRSRRCSASRTVSPRSCTRRVMAASTSSAAAGSSAEVGSSSTRTRGWLVMTAPRATRCCSPPDRSARGRLRSPPRPSRSTTSSTRVRITEGDRPSCSMPYASSSSTESVTNPASGSCPTTPTTSARSRGRWWRVSRPSMRTRPVSRPPVKWGVWPHAARSSVDLPAPVGPITRHSSPSSTCALTLRSAGSLRPAYVTLTSSKRIIARVQAGPRPAGRPAVRRARRRRGRRVAGSASSLSRAPG